MSLVPSDYHASNIIGLGGSNRADVRRLRRSLARIGYGESLNSRANNVTPGLMAAVARFQSDFGLEPDSVIKPGGPTERALSMAVHARNQDGSPAVARLRDDFARHAEAGLIFRPHPQDRDSGVWMDEEGQEFSEPSLVVPKRQHAMMLQEYLRREEARRRASEPSARRNAPSNSRSPAPYMAPPLAPLGVLLRAMELYAPRGDDSDHEIGAGRGAPTSVRRTVPPENLDVRIPPFPSEPPDGTDDDERVVPEPRRGTTLIFPVSGKDEWSVLTFPDMSHIAERWRVLHNSRGSEEGQQRDVAEAIEILFDSLEERGVHVDLMFGGVDPKTKQKVKELFLHRTPGVVRGGRRPDIVIKMEESGVEFWLYINVQDTWKDGETPTLRERLSLADIPELLPLYARDTNDPARIGDVIGIPKAKYWDRTEWQSEIKRRADEFFGNKFGPKKRR